MKKNSNNIKIDIMKNKIFIMIVSVLAITFSCSDFEKFELPESGSIEDATPPNASFSGFPEEGFEEQFRNYTFSNTSTSATIYDWDFGDGAGSTEFEPMRADSPISIGPSTCAPAPTTTLLRSVGWRLPAFQLVPPKVTP